MNPWSQFWKREGQVFAAAGRSVATGWRWLLLVALLTGCAAGLLHFYDPALKAWLPQHRNPFWMEIARQLSRWGELHMAPLLALVLLGFAGFFRKQSRWIWGAIAGVHAGVMGGILVNIVKWIASRPRPSTPYEDGFYWFRHGWDFASFPSGHATHCLAIVAAVALFVPRYSAVLALGAVGVAWSRWYLERHYVTDLFGGAGLGLTVGVIMGLAVRSVYAVPVGPKIPARPEEVGK